MHRADRGHECDKVPKAIWTNVADQDDHRPPHALRNLREERDDQQRERHEQYDAAVKAWKIMAPVPGAAGLDAPVERAAVLDPVQLREDRIADGSRLDCNQRRDGIGKYSIDRFHELPSDSVSDPPPESGHKNKDAVMCYEMPVNLY